MEAVVLLLLLVTETLNPHQVRPLNPSPYGR